jgi:glycosyltransferase involved in cell wall biosynthesis
MTPKFSVAIPAYNHANFLAEAIGSVLEQTVDDFEIIVSDDCSKVDLSAVTRSFSDSRIRYSRSAQALGATGNHARAVSLARGTYVLCLNHDDKLLPNCLAVAGETLEARSTAAAVYFPATYLEGIELCGAERMPVIDFADSSTLAANPWLEQFHGTSPSCCLFRRQNFERIGGYRLSLRFAYDWDLYIRLIRQGGGVVFLKEILSIYRRHSEQMVATRPLDGLRDILDLWDLPEYRHWTSAEISELVMSCLGIAIRAHISPLSVITEINQRHLWLRLFPGLAGAITRRLTGRHGSGVTDYSRFFVPVVPTSNLS